MEEVKDILNFMDKNEDLITELLSIKIPTKTLVIDKQEPSDTYDQMVKDIHSSIMKLATAENLKLARENEILGRLFITVQDKFNKFRERQNKEKIRHQLTKHMLDALKEGTSKVDDKITIIWNK